MSRSHSLIGTLAALCAAMTLAGCDSGHSAPSAPSAASPLAPGSARHSFVSDGSQYGVTLLHGAGSGYDSIYRAASYMAQAGVQFARITIYRQELQPAAGALDATAVANLHTTLNAIAAGGLAVFVTLETTPAHAAYPGVNSPWAYPEPTSWADYIQRLVNEFPGIQYWSIQNEPNGTFLVPPAGMSNIDAYRHMIEIAAPIIRSGNGRMVVGPETSSHQQSWFGDFMSTHGSYVDIASVHEYNDSFTAIGPAMSQYAQSMVATGNGSKDLWLTETSSDNALSETVKGRWVYGVYAAMNAGTVPQWSKTFYYRAGAQPQALATGISSTSPTPLHAYNCYRYIALGVFEPNCTSF